MEILLFVFTRFSRFSKGVFCRKSSIWMGRNDRLKPGKLLSLIEHIENKTRQFSISLTFREQNIFKRWAFVLTHLVQILVGLAM